MRDPLMPFELGWPIRRGDGLDDLKRFLREPAFRPSFRLPGGQFALCIRDESSGLIAVLRDPSASMPLHAHFDGSRWLVSDSVRSIEERAGRKFPLNLDVLKILHRTARLSPCESIYRDIELCAPGVVHVLAPNGQSTRFPIHIEWSRGIDLARSDWGDPTALAKSVADTVSRSVRDAIGPDKAIVQQSGGLDSNLILHAAVRSGLEVSAQGMTFPGLECDESEAMRASAEVAGVAYDPVDCAGQAYSNWKDELFQRSEYVPFTTTFMPLMMAQRAKRLGFQVMLNGMGGDEIFSETKVAGRAFLTRFHPALGAYRIKRAELTAFARSLARRWLSGRQSALSVFLYSGNWYFQMCATQITQDAGVELRLPFCDWRTVVAIRPLSALSAILGFERRELQRALLHLYSPALHTRLKFDKVNFNTIGSAFATPESHPTFGPARFPRFASLVPDFARYQQAAGRKIQ